MFTVAAVTEKMEGVILVRILWMMALSARAVECATESGREFVLAFPVITGTFQDGPIYLYIKGPQSATVTVTFPGQAPKVYTLGISAKQIRITTMAAYRKNTIIKDKGVLVECSSDITVYVIRGYDEGYVALPKTPWSTQFVVASYTPSPGGHSYFAIAAYEDNTDVEMNFREGGIGDCENLLPSSGVPLMITLQKQQVWAVHCSQQDLTGTLVKSSKPISVVSGAVIPLIGEFSTALDFMEEMLMPVDFQGINFVIPTVSGTSVVLRIIASANETIVYEDGMTSTYLNAGDFYDIRTHYSPTMCVKGTHPLQVMLLGKDANVSPHSADGILGDPFMLTIPPVENFRKSYKIEVFYGPLAFPKNLHLIFLLETIYKDDIAESLPWTNDSLYGQSDCCNYAAVYLVLDKNAENFNVSKNYSFAVLYIGTMLGSGFALMLGTSLGTPYCPESEGYTYLNASNLCIQGYTDPSSSWKDALKFCEVQRGSLVKLNTTRKIVGIKKHLGGLLSKKPFWIGQNRFLGTRRLWTDGEKEGVTDWVDSEPNNSGECTALGTFLGHIGWNDKLCGSKKYFVCEIKLTGKRNISLFTKICKVQDPSCPTSGGYMYLSLSNVCIRQPDIPMSWTDANADCRASGDHLVTVDTYNKQTELHTLFRHIWSAYHIGASWHNIGSGTWVWTDCTPLSYSNWVNGEPGGNHSNCVTVNINGSWCDVACNSRQWFICQKDLTISNTTVLQVTGANDGTCENDTTLAHTSSPSSQLSVESVLVSTWEHGIQTTSFEAPPSLYSQDLTSVSSTDSVEQTSEVTSSTADISSTSVEVSPSMTILLTLTEGQTSYTLDTEYTSTLYDSTEYLVPSTLHQFPDLPQSSVDDSAKSPVHNGLYTSVVAQTASSLYSVIPSERVVTRVCRCACVSKNRLEDLSPEAVSAKDKEIKDELLLNTKKLTNTISKHICRSDGRMSASGIGALGVALIAFTLLVIFCSDIMTVMKHSRPHRKI